MSYYPPGAFDALTAREDQQEKFEMTHEQALADRKKELRENDTVTYTHYYKPQSAESVKWLWQEMDDSLLKKAIVQWRKGNLDQAGQIFADACDKALHDAADFLATCDANAEGF